MEVEKREWEEDERCVEELGKQWRQRRTKRRRFCKVVQ